ncbi:predicted protein [Coccidioides posadasii str. Silveira]|uniref:Predicted protein n=2 Tax=Coccidioides posadasii TaxID=199306 RepID=E9CWI2_COCPS|nr:predicted protein [Coccidioides posadasii str. Silveira]KMM65129.1 hypothetical protein CPAG_01481 [Coccidioides posadasii RMSCC 3488]
MDQEERDEAREFSQIPPVSSAEASIPKDIKKRHQTYQVGLHRREHNARYLQLYPVFRKDRPPSADALKGQGSKRRGEPNNNRGLWFSDEKSTVNQRGRESLGGREVLPSAGVAAAGAARDRSGVNGRSTSGCDGGKGDVGQLSP